MNDLSSLIPQSYLAWRRYIIEGFTLAETNTTSDAHVNSVLVKLAKSA